MTGGNEFTLLSGERAVIYDEIHGQCRLGNFLERNGNRILRCADGITDMDICNTGNSYDGTDLCLCDIHLVQTVKLVKLADADAFLLVRLVVVYNNRLLIDF